MTEAFYQITDDGFPGAKSVDFIGQRIVYVEPFGRYWGWSSLADGTSWNSLDQAQAETAPDRIQGLIVSHNEVLLFGERTIEPWAHAPDGNAVFQLQVGSVIESGCASGKSIKRLDNSVFYLTENGQVARLNGYTPQIVSTAAMEAAIRDCRMSRAFACTWEDSGHCVYYITFPDGHTWGYDVRQGLWHRRESFGLDRWRINALIKSNGTWYAGDYANGRVYEMEWGNTYEGCEIMPRKMRTGVLHNAMNRMHVHGFRLNVATGQPAKLPTSTTPPVPVFGSVLVTGNELGAGEPKWAIATPAAEPEFTGLATSTGANLTAPYPAYYKGVWCVVGSGGGVRYLEAESLAADDAWLTATSGITLVPRSLVGGEAGWLMIDGDNSPSLKAALVPSAGFASYTFAHMDGATNLGTTYAAYDLAYTGGSYYAGSDNGSVVGLVGSSLLGASWDVLVNRGDDPSDPFSLGKDFREFNGELYAIHHVSLGGANRLGKSSDGGRTWTTVKNFAAISSDLWPTQLEVGNGVLLALTQDSRYVWTSADDFAEEHETGIYGRTSGATGRHLAYTSGLFYVISGETESNSPVRNRCVTTPNGIDFSDPSEIPLSSVVGIAASADPDEEVVVNDTCEPMEPGVIQLRYSNDGAENFTNWRDFDAPTTGRFLQPLVARRLGMARHRVWEIMDTSNRPQDVLAASIIAE